MYDRYGSLEHAEEAFSQVMRMQPDFEKANEIYFRLGIIYKQQQKFQQSLEVRQILNECMSFDLLDAKCFKYIVQDPPRPLTEEDIWFQIGHVHEQQKDVSAFRILVDEVLTRSCSTTLQSWPIDEYLIEIQIMQRSYSSWGGFTISKAIVLVAKRAQLSILKNLSALVNIVLRMRNVHNEANIFSDNTDAQSWYLLGRCYMSQQKYSKAYEAYQQAVYRDGRNPTFWCSIGVLYYQINQYRDALDAYSRAIRLNPYISEVWYDLGTLVCLYAEWLRFIAHIVLV